MNQRRLVGMSMGARKRAARAHFMRWNYEMSVANRAYVLALFSPWDAAAVEYKRLRGLVRIGQRLRPCPGCADCDPCMSSYGSFYGGDPRRFTPDEECSTDQERELHRKHCEEWARGERPSVKVSGVEWVDDITYQDSDGKTQTIKASHKLVERAAYGLGVSRLTDDDSGLFCDGSGVLPAKGKTGPCSQK